MAIVPKLVIGLFTSLKEHAYNSHLNSQKVQRRWRRRGEKEEEEERGEEEKEKEEKEEKKEKKKDFFKFLKLKLKINLPILLLLLNALEDSNISKHAYNMQQIKTIAFTS